MSPASPKDTTGNSSPKFGAYAQIVERLGFPIVLTFGMAWGIYQAGSVLVEAHVRHMDTVAHAIQRIEKVLEEDSRHKLDIVKALVEITYQLKELRKP